MNAFEICYIVTVLATMMLSAIAWETTGELSGLLKGWTTVALVGSVACVFPVYAIIKFINWASS